MESTTDSGCLKIKCFEQISHTFSISSHTCDGESIIRDKLNGFKNSGNNCSTISLWHHQCNQWMKNIILKIMLLHALYNYHTNIFSVKGSVSSASSNRTKPKRNTPLHYSSSSSSNSRVYIKQKARKIMSSFIKK